MGEIYLFSNKMVLLHTGLTILCGCYAQLLSDTRLNWTRLEIWPPNPPDLNPEDYGIWEWLQERVYHEPVHDLAKLKQWLVNTWADVKQSVVDKAVK